MTEPTGGSEKHGMRWFSGYALARPNNLTCGFITNPDDAVMSFLTPCGLPASYEFQFKDRKLDTWSAACTEHAAIVRQHGLIERISSIRPGSEVPSLTDEQRTWLSQTGWR